MDTCYKYIIRQGLDCSYQHKVPSSIYKHTKQCGCGADAADKLVSSLNRLEQYNHGFILLIQTKQININYIIDIIHSYMVPMAACQVKNWRTLFRSRCDIQTKMIYWIAVGCTNYSCVHSLKYKTCTIRKSPD